MDANVLLARGGRQGLNTPGNAGLHGKVQGLDEHYSPVAYCSPFPNSIFYQKFAIQFQIIPTPTPKLPFLETKFGDTSKFLQILRNSCIF